MKLAGGCHCGGAEGASKAQRPRQERGSISGGAPDLAQDGPLAQLKEVGAALSRPPENFDLNPKILRQLEADGLADPNAHQIAAAAADGTLVVRLRRRDAFFYAALRK